MNFQDSIVAVITDCPRRQHPNTGVELAYASIRYHLPESDILILQDGIRFETECLRPRFEEYKNKIRQKIESGQWTNTRTITFDEHRHQAGMMRDATNKGWIRQPLILFIEPDLRLSADTIDWENISKTLLDGEIVYIHFNDEAELDGPVFQSKYGVPLVKTRGFTTTPFISRTDFITHILSVYNKARTFLEDRAVNELIQSESLSLATYVPAGNSKRWLGGDISRVSKNGWNGPHFPVEF